MSAQPTNTPASPRKRPSLASTLKSRDTEETFDLIFYRPIGYVWALICRRLGIVPNAVTIVAIILGTAGGILLGFGTLSLTLWAIALIVLANSLDSADGQLARMTGQYSRLGRFLDGMCGDIWFIAIYVSVAYRISVVTDWGIFPWLLGVITGVFHAKQAAMADYYRNFHLFIRKANGTNRPNSPSPTATRRGFPISLPNFRHFLIGGTPANKSVPPPPCNDSAGCSTAATATSGPCRCARHSGRRASR